MKRILLPILLLPIFFAFSQEKITGLEKFDISKMETAILVQQSPIINIQDYQNQTNSVYGFFQAYKTIQQNDFQRRFPALEVLKEQKLQSYLNKTLPLSILISDYETIKKDALIEGKVSNNTQGYLINNAPGEYIYNQHHIFLSSVLRETHSGLQTTFELPSENIFNSSDRIIDFIEFDFGDGKGFIQIQPNTPIVISYPNAGKKEILARITFSDQSTSVNSSSLKITYNHDNLKQYFNRNPVGFTGTTTPNLSLYGVASYPGQAEYEIFISTEPDAILDKPIIIIDGFDPGNTRPIAGYDDNGNFINGIYELLNFTNDSGQTNNLADLIRAEGYDVIILNFPTYIRPQDNELIDGGADFVERNAMLLVDLINIINNQKTGQHQNVIIGPSMGGLISRYALGHMENIGLDHDTRLWLSFDSPHLGANVPIGFQHHFNFLAFGLNDFWFIGNQNVEELQPLIDGFMKSSAARQMLVDHFESHITDSDGVTFNDNLTLPVAHPFKDIFYNGLNSLTASGYPENLRKINIINGSGIGLPYQDVNGNDIYPGRRVVDVGIDVETGVDANLKVNYTSTVNNQIVVSDVYIDFAWWVPAFDVYNDAESRAHSYSHGVDAAPGGLFDLGQITEDIDTSGITGEFLNALQTDFFNFIPTVSAMAIDFPNDQINWFFTPNGNNPFDAWYMPDANEPHVTLTQANVDFAWDEIVLRDPLSTNYNTLESGLSIVNPVQDILEITNNITLHNLSIDIVDITGKIVFSQSINNPGTQINVNLNVRPGIYFVKFHGDSEITNKKIIIQ